MDRLRRRDRMVFSGFTGSETEKLDTLYTKYGTLSINRDICVKVARSFSRSSGRAGKPIVKWPEVQTWFQNKLKVSPVKASPPPKNVRETNPSPDKPKLAACPEDSDQKKANETNLVHKAGEEIRNLTENTGRLRRRDRMVFSGFTGSETEKLDALYTKYGGLSVNRDICVKIARSFSRSTGRAGKPIVKWTEVQTWFQNRLHVSPVKLSPPPKNVEKTNPSPDVPKLDACPEETDQKKAIESDLVHKPRQLPKMPGERIWNLKELEFEAKSSTDGAWYDVEKFVTHRFARSGEAEVRVRFEGFSAKDDEWVNVKSNIRERSVPLENWECRKVQVGDVMLCLQERKDQAVYYDARILDIKRRMHDIRGCRCIFSVQYTHDETKENVRLPRLCSIR